MKTNNYVEDLRTKSVDELNAQLVEAKKELFNLRFQNATNQLENTGRIKEVRRNIARFRLLSLRPLQRISNSDLKKGEKSWKKEILEKHV